MIWKIFFILLALLFTFLQIGGLTSTMMINEFNLASGYIAAGIILFITGYFFALGWKKRLFSLKANNIIFAIIVAFVIFTIVEAVKVGLPVLVFQLKNSSAGNPSDSSIYMTSLLVLLLTAFVIYSILYLPAIIAYFKYKKYYSEMSDVQKPYWKIFLTYFAVTLLVNSAYLLFFTDKTNYNIWDYAVMCSCLIDVPFLIGYAYNIKFGKQIIWKLLTVPYIILNACTFWCSTDFLNTSQIYLVKESYTVAVLTILTTVAIFYTLYRYAFTKDVYNDEQVEKYENEN